MWNNYSFVSEILGTFILVFGVIASNKTKAKLGLKGYIGGVFTAVTVGIALMLAVYTAEINFGGFKGNSHGFVNPAVALMHAIGNANYDFLLPSVAGELVGGFAAVILGFVITIAKIGPKAQLVSKDTIDIKSSDIREIVGSTIFLGGVAIAVFSGIPAAATGLIVGLSAILALITVGNSKGALLNPAVGMSLLLESLLETRKVTIAQLVGYATPLTVNISIAAAIGGTYLGLMAM